ncbi:DUF4158 domain-containing protein [Rhizobium sp. 2YAF20]
MSDNWSLSFADIDFINSKPATTRLGLAAQLSFFNARGFFADDGTLIPNDAAEYLAERIGVRADELSSYDFGGRSAQRHCAEILQYLGYRRMTCGPGNAVFLDYRRTWYCQVVCLWLRCGGFSSHHFCSIIGPQAEGTCPCVAV